MEHHISTLSAAAVGFYAMVLLACAFAALSASHKLQPRWHLVVWSLLVVLFGILMISRLTGLEEGFRESFRETMRSSGKYSGRRSVQGIAMSALLIAFFGLGIFAFARISRVIRGRRDRLVVMALCAGSVMVVLVSLRLVSLHMIDRALYGPLKLNWIADAGSSLLIIGAAVFYVKRIGGRS